MSRITEIKIIPLTEFIETTVRRDVQRVHEVTMRGFTAVIERCPETGLYIGYVPGFPGAHTQGESLDELHRNLLEVIEMLLEDGEQRLDSEFVGVHQLVVQ